MRCLDGITDSKDMGLSKLLEMVKARVNRLERESRPRYPYLEWGSWSRKGLDQGHSKEKRRKTELRPAAPLAEDRWRGFRRLPLLADPGGNHKKAGGGEGS